VDRATRVANQMLALAKVEQLRQEDSNQNSAMLAQLDDIDVALELSR
jgi:two-component system sensor histidine kinase TctE